MKRFAALAAVAVAANLALAGGVPQYTAAVLPQLDPNQNPDILTMTVPTALSDTGTVLGVAGLDGIPGAPGGFSWSAGQGATLLQPQFEGIADYVSPNAINSAGAMAGTYLVEGGALGDVRAFHLGPDNTVTTLPALPGHQLTGAVDMNEGGMIVGLSFGGSFASGVYWQDSGGTFTASTIPGPGGPFLPSGVNDSGVVAGYAQVEQFDPYLPYVWSTAGGLEALDPLVADTPATPNDVNNEGIVVGRAGINLFQNKAVYWTLDGADHELPSLFDYSPNDFADVQVLAVNDAGLMAGFELSGLTVNFSARLWVDDQVYDLEDLVVDLPDGYTLQRAVDINENGDLVVEASTIVNGQITFATVLLTVVPEPSGLVLLGSAALVAGVRRRRGRRA